MQVLQGEVLECRYEYSKEPSMDGHKGLTCIHNETYHEGQLAYIADSLGYHKVGNPTKATPAVTLHLYCPPIDVCNIWLQEDGPPCKSYSCLYSEYGVKTVP
jgi:cysteine dioxygenase